MIPFTIAELKELRQIVEGWCRDYPASESPRIGTTLYLRLLAAAERDLTNDDGEALARLNAEAAKSIQRLGLSTVPAAGSLKADEVWSYVTIAEREINRLRACSAWTHNKPTVGGLYLLREGPQTTPTMHHLYRQEDGRIQILDTESHYTGDDVQSLHFDYEWYGPIPWE